MAKLAKSVVSPANMSGEGWFLTAEMLELIHGGVNNIICMQPFACLPNHVTGKGVMKEIKKQNPNANIVAVDYDPGASEVNQINRIKLMMSVAFSNLKGEQAEPLDLTDTGDTKPKVGRDYCGEQFAEAAASEDRQSENCGCDDCESCGKCGKR